MHGGASEWIFEPYKEGLEDSEDTEIGATTKRPEPFAFGFDGIARGGSTTRIIEKARSASRTPAASGGASSGGFRVARTLPLITDN